jgi:hypothetical protein
MSAKELRAFYEKECENVVLEPSNKEDQNKLLKYYVKDAYLAALNLKAAADISDFSEALEEVFEFCDLDKTFGLTLCAYCTRIHCEYAVLKRNTGEGDVKKIYKDMHDLLILVQKKASKKSQKLVCFIEKFESMAGIQYVYLLFI